MDETVTPTMPDFSKASNAEELTSIYNTLSQQGSTAPRSTAESQQNVTVPATLLEKSQPQLTTLPSDSGKTRQQEFILNDEASALAGIQRDIKEEKKGLTAIEKKRQEQRDIVTSKGEFTIAEQEKQGLDKANEVADELTNQFEALSLSARRRQEAADLEAGLTKSQVDARQRQMAKDDTSKLADIALALNAANRNVLRINESIKTKVDLFFADEERKLDFLEQDYQALQSALTQKEQTVVQEQLARERADIDAKRAMKTQIETAKANAIMIASQNGDMATVQKLMELGDNATLSDVSALTPRSLKEQLEIQNIQSQIGARGISNRLALLELAESGDASAITQLGFDPNKTPTKLVEEYRKNEIALDQASNYLDTINDALSSDRAIAGATTSVGGAAGTVSRFFGALKGPSVSVKGGQIVTEDGGFGAQADLLSSVQTIINKETLNALSNLEVKLTPVSEGELKLVGSSANRLTSMAIFDENDKVVGLKGTPEQVMAELNVIQGSMSKVVDEIQLRQLDESELFELYQ